MPSRCIIRIASVRLSRRETLARVFDDSCSRRNMFCRESALSLNRRTADLEWVIVVHAEEYDGLFGFVFLSRPGLTVVEYGDEHDSADDVPGQRRYLER